MGRFKQVTKLKETINKLQSDASRPHAEMVYWALKKARAQMNEEERAKYEPLMEKSLTELEQYFAREDARCSKA